MSAKSAREASYGTFALIAVPVGPATKLQLKIVKVREGGVDTSWSSRQGAKSPQEEAACAIRRMTTPNARGASTAQTRASNKVSRNHEFFKTQQHDSTIRNL